MTIKAQPYRGAPGGGPVRPSEARSAQAKPASEASRFCAGIPVVYGSTGGASSRYAPTGYVLRARSQQEPPPTACPRYAAA